MTSDEHRDIYGDSIEKNSYLATTARLATLIINYRLGPTYFNKYILPKDITSVSLPKYLIHSPS